MARWEEYAAEQPEHAAAARALLTARRHLVIATLRRDGAPRVSGIEALFRDGELMFGMMWRSAKALDLRRDPRFALHSAGADPPPEGGSSWAGDVTVSGVVEEVREPERVREAIGEDAPPGPAHLFRADISEVMLVRVGDPPDHLVLQTWRAGEGVSRTTRR